LIWSNAAFGQAYPLSTDLEGYYQYWTQQTPEQRVQWARNHEEDGLEEISPAMLAESWLFQPDAVGETPPATLIAAALPESLPAKPAAPTPLSAEERLQRLLAEGAAAVAQREQPSSSASSLAALPPATDSIDPAASNPADLAQETIPPPPATPLMQAAALQVDPDPQPWIQTDSMLDVLAPALIDQVDPDSLPTHQQAKASPDSAEIAPPLLQQFPLFQQDLPSTAADQPSTAAEPTQELKQQNAPQLAQELLDRFPLFQPQPQAQQPSQGSDSFVASELLDKFPLLQPSSPSSLPSAGQGDPSVNAATEPSKGSQIRQQLEANVQTQIPLDPDQLNVSGDVLSFDAERQVGIAEGNARIQLSDGTTITGDKLLFYRKEQRLRSEGPFIMQQPIGGIRSKGSRKITGLNLDLDIPSRSAQFESSLVELPGEAPGTKVYVRSEETTALLGDQIFFENATVTTSPEAPITHYVKGNRVEVFPDDRVIIYEAHVYAGGEQDGQGDLQAGTQIGYFPLFVYSLKDHQWILPGQSEPEGVFVKSSWAYRFNDYHFGGLRVDALQKKGLGLGVIHDYILPITDSTNYGRAQFYLVTEADENRLSSRFRVDHFFDFYAAKLLGNDGELKGQLNINLDNTYRPAGGRNDNADFRFNATFKADLSTTTFNINRTGSPTRGTYSLPVTLNHSQQYGNVRWLKSNIRLDYNQRVTSANAPAIADARLTLDTQAKPPGWLGNYQLTYRTYSSSNGDRESRKNLEFVFTPDAWKIVKGITLTSNLTITQNQQPDQVAKAGLNFFNKYESRSSLRFDAIKPAKWITINPGSIDYFQALYSTSDQESTVTLNPRISLTPADWNTIELRYNRIFNGNNSVPFQTAASNPKDTDKISTNISFFTPKNNLPQVPPGYVAFEDDLPGEQPIALTFPDDTSEDLEVVAQKDLSDLQANVRSLLRLDTSTGYNFVDQKWDLVNANFTWNTTPNLFNVQLQTSYDPNQGEFRPVTLRYSGRTSTTFQKDLRSGLNSYEPGFSYGLSAVYDPREGDVRDYSLDLDATIGTQWQNHWRFRLGLAEDGIRRIEVRRDLRDFEIRLAYDPGAELLRLEGILVAFPSRPVGLTQERGDFTFTTPAGSFGSDQLLP
jgi:hypothetical protein